MLGWGLADFFAKKTIDRIGDVTTLFWGHVFGTLIFALIALSQPLTLNTAITFPNTLQVWIGVVFFGVLQATVYLLVYVGFGKGKLALLNPVFASYSGVAALLSILFLGEVVSGYLLMAVLTIFFGVLLLSLDVEALRSRSLRIFGSPGLKEVAMAAVLASIWTLSWDRFVKGSDWIVYAFLMYAFMTLAIFLYAKAKGVQLLFSDPDSWKFLSLIGGCEVIAYLMLSLGFSTTSYTSIIAVLSGAFSLPTIILARVFLKERITFLQAIGSFIIIAGIVALSLR